MSIPVFRRNRDPYCPIPLSEQGARRFLIPAGFLSGKVILYSSSKLREAQYHSAQAGYNCNAISLAEGEYN